MLIPNLDGGSGHWQNVRDLQPFCGVDLKPYFPQEAGESKTLWERWVRCVMGFKSPPYFCIKALLFALEFIRGD